MTQIQKQNYCCLSSLVCVCEGKETLAGQRERNRAGAGGLQHKGTSLGEPSPDGSYSTKEMLVCVCPSLGQSHRGPAAPELGNGTSCSPRECPAAAVWKFRAGILLQCPGCSGLARVSSTAKVKVPCGKILLSLDPAVLSPGSSLDGGADEGFRSGLGCSHGTGWRCHKPGAPRDAGAQRSSSSSSSSVWNHWVGMGGCSLLTASRAPWEAALPAWQSWCCVGSPRGCSPCHCLFVPGSGSAAPALPPKSKAERLEGADLC